ncbi:uncharacterized protein LOC143058683 [Mytilus galloprovincialis]|uniref:uncharacterized protein LOC143058683 n=1 Tax=Mytilus galloprovincialis TaxID=29158 RepID=UPI003F7B79E0
MVFRYISQILGEMAALNTPDLLYLSWTEESTTVIKAKFDEDLWNLMESEIKNLYGIPIPKKPTRISENVKNIKLRMKSYNENFTEFLCEVPSLKGTCTEIAQTIPESPYLFPIHIETISIPLNNMDILFTEIISSLREAFEICRKKASEVLVWLLSDTDRNWNEEIPHSLPIGYAMKGYSLPTSPMRNMHNAMLQACYDKDIHIACSCFDGQWIKLASRDASDKPLTLLQLQRDVSEKSRKTSRDVILNELTRTPIAQTLEDLTIDKKDNGGYYVSCSLYSKIMRCIISYKQIKQRQPVETDEDVLTSDITSYLPEVALEALIENETETDFIAALDSTGNQTEESELDTSSSANISAVRQIDQTTSNASLSDSDYQYILQSLISHQKSSVQAKWKDKDVQILKKSIADTQILKKLSHDELNVIIGSTEQLQKKAGLMIRKSWRILEKVNGISKLVGDGKQIESERKVRSMLTLREFAARRIKGSSAQNTKRVPKDILNLVYSTISYQAAYIDWIAKCPFDKNVEDIGSTEWFSYPEFNDIRQKLEPACIDAHHLLVNLRSKVCKDGLQNIRKQAWVAVANKNRDIISKSLVVDIIDKQNNAFAKRTFSRDVEIEMRNLAFDKEADFCQIVREWYEAEDTPGFSSKERIRRKLRLKEFLLEGVDFGQFPMFGMYVKGFPKVMFEGFLQRIDTTIQLYSIVKSGTYNHRAISSLVNETFFGELSDMEPTRLGCPKAISIPRLMSTVTEIFHYRCDPSERSFRINTTRKAVYPEVQLVDNFVQPVDVNMQDVSSDLYLRSITLRDHLFDKPIRRRRKQRTTKRSDVSKPGEVARGCLPIRQHHKTDESKILPTTRLGIDMKDLDGK